MMLLWLALWRQLRAQAWASLSVLLGVALALASVVAVHLLGQRISSELEAGFPAAVAGLTHEYRPAGLTETHYFALRQRWRAGEPLLTLADGSPAPVQIQAMAPLLDLSVQAQDAQGGQWRVLGMDPLALPATTGLALSAPELLLEDAVLSFGPSTLEIGSWLQPAGDGPALRVIGELDVEPQAHWLLADIATAQAIVGTPGHLDALGLALPSGPPAWLRVLDRWFPGLAAQWQVPPLLLLDGEPVQALGDAAQRRFVDAILFNLGALSLLAALVAGFLVYQSALGSVRQRLPLLSRLRMLGISRRYVLVQVMAESLVLGLLGTLLALPLGMALAQALLQLVGGGVAGGALPTTGAQFSLPLEVWLKALLLGVGSAGLGGWLAYHKLVPGRWLQTQSDAQPVAAAALHRRHLLLIAVGLALLLLGCWVPATGLVGAFIAIAGACVMLLALLPWLLQTLVTGLLRALDANALRLTPGAAMGSLLNLRELRAALPQVQAAGGALLLALAVAMALGLMVGSLRASFDAMLAQRLAADLVINLGTTDPDNAQDWQTLAELPGVLEVRGYGSLNLPLVHGQQAVLTRVQVAQLDAWELGRYNLSPQASAQQVPLYVNELLARQLQLQPGMQVQLLVTESPAAGPLAVVIAGVFADYGAARPRALLDSSALLESGALPAPITQVALRVEAGAAAALAVALQQQGWRVSTLAELRDFSQQLFARTFRITDALTALALLVAVVGLYNAFTALQLARRSEWRLLQGMGYTSAMLTRLSLQQVLLLALLLVLLAVPLAVLMAWLLCALVNPRAFGWSIPLQLQLWPLLLPMVLGMLAAALAGWLPARRALRPAAASVPATASAVLMVGLLPILLLLPGCGAAPAETGTSLRLDALLASEAEEAGFAKAEQPRPFEFPLDHGPHPDYRSEWWYLTLDLHSAEGARYGAQFTLFRQAAAPPLLAAALPDSELRAGLVRVRTARGRHGMISLGADGPELPLGSFAPDPLALVESLAPAARQRLLRLLLDAGTGLFSLQTEPAYLALAVALAREEAVAAEPARAVAAGPEQLRLVRASGPRPAGPLFLVGPTRIARIAATGGATVHMLIEAPCPGEVLCGGTDMPWVRRIAAPGGDTPPLLDLLAAGGPESRAIGAQLPAALCHRGDAPASAGLHDAASLHAPARPRSRADLGRAVAGMLELALPDCGGGLFLRGWLRDPHGLIAGLALATPSGPRLLPGETVHRFRRRDLADRFRNVAHAPGEEGEGFVVHVPDAAGAGPQPDLLVQLKGGAALALTPALRTLAPAAARHAVLASVRPEALTEAMLAHCIVPAASRLHAAVQHPRLSPLAGRAAPRRPARGRRRSRPVG